MVDVGETKISRKFVGALLWDDDRKLASFQYSQEFINEGWDLSPLKMPITDGSRIFSFPELQTTRYF
jgi:serine/threonine-protein kinase HipA